MQEPVWLDQELILLLHEDVIAETGGAPGVRDPGLLESALQRAPNRFAYEGVDDLLELAATYAVAIAKNHPFTDGNKRAAFMALGLFLDDNGLALSADQDDAAQVMLGVAAGEIGIEGLSAWLYGKITLA